MKPSSVTSSPKQHHHAARQKCGVIKVHPRRRVRRLPLLGRERLQNRATRARIELVETSIIGRAGGLRARDDHPAVNLSPFAARWSSWRRRARSARDRSRFSSRCRCQEASFRGIETKARTPGKQCRRGGKAIRNSPDRRFCCAARSQAAIMTGQPRMPAESRPNSSDLPRDRPDHRRAAGRDAQAFRRGSRCARWLS